MYLEISNSLGYHILIMNEKTAFSYLKEDFDMDPPAMCHCDLSNGEEDL